MTEVIIDGNDVLHRLRHVFYPLTFIHYDPFLDEIHLYTQSRYSYAHGNRYDLEEHIADLLDHEMLHAVLNHLLFWELKDSIASCQLDNIHGFNHKTRQNEFETADGRIKL